MLQGSVYEVAYQNGATQVIIEENAQLLLVQLVDVIDFANCFHIGVVFFLELQESDDFLISAEAACVDENKETSKSAEAVNLFSCETFDDLVIEVEILPELNPTIFFGAQYLPKGFYVDEYT